MDRSCATCKHFEKKLTEEPCLQCNIALRNDKWEANDDGRKTDSDN